MLLFLPEDRQQALLGGKRFGEYVPFFEQLAKTSFHSVIRDTIGATLVRSSGSTILSTTFCKHSSSFVMLLVLLRPFFNFSIARETIKYGQILTLFLACPRYKQLGQTEAGRFPITPSW